MKHEHAEEGSCCCCRREFLQTMGAAAGAMALASSGGVLRRAEGGEEDRRERGVATVRGAFVYPPTQTLQKEGYYSWPGSSFDAEGHQKRYMAEIRKIERDLGMRIVMDERPLDGDGDVARFIEEAKRSRPDGLLLIPFKKGHWPKVVRIVEETRIPSVVLATLGVLLVGHINELHRRPGAHLISAMDDLKAVRDGMRMIRAARRMKENLLISINGTEVQEGVAPGLGTRVRTVPLERFYDAFRETAITDDVRKLAQFYLRGAREVVEPSEQDVLDAARACIALKKVLKAERGDALMMNCLPGLKRPHRHVPPCMGFMSLRDEGVPAGCQADLKATLTMMLVQELFDRPGFQQNASMQTESNHYFGAHCTAPSRMLGADGPAEPYILRTHAEAGWGCVPQVLFRPGQEVTMALYLPADSPRMLIYSGSIVRCYPKAPGGCRTNIEMTINEVDDVCDVQGMHQIIFYGNYARALRAFCQLYGIEAVS